MAIDFASLVDKDTKREMLTGTIQQLIYQGYQHEINRKIAESLESQEGVDLADEYLARTEAQLLVLQEELDSLG
jgi:hypothetical protein